MRAMSGDSADNPAEQPGRARSSNRIWGALCGVLAALPASVWLWGFTVDDALISARVAAHLAAGGGYRFNPRGPIVDAVTPLGYAPLLSLFGHGDAWHIFGCAKWLGLSAWLLAAGILGWLVASAGERARRFLPLGALSLCTPPGAWAVSGMETGLVMLLATLGLLGGWAGALAVGVAAGWRPELVPFAAVLVLARARADHATVPRRAQLLALALLPALAAALVRVACFGRAVPLAFYAKPSDFGHGLRYALGAFAFTGLPWLSLATPREFIGLAPRERALLAAIVAHFGALILCGGDWMALFRLAVPVLPAVVLAAACIAEQSRGFVALALRSGLALVGSLSLALVQGRAARGVGTDRAALIAEARPVLARDARIAAVDVGWLGVARDSEIIDLAGVTDDQVALFPGGHTSKRIPGPWLFARRPTAIVLLLERGAALETPFENSRFALPVQRRVALLVAAEFSVRTLLHLGDREYVVLEPTSAP